MTRLPLASRILIVTLGVQLLLFAALAAASLGGLRRDIATETRLATETARSLVLATVGTLQGSVPPDRLMAALPERLVPPRHTRIAIIDPRVGVMPGPTTPTAQHTEAPGWFAAMVTPDPVEIRLPVSVDRRLRGYVTIAGDPRAEIALAWQDMRTVLGLAALAGLAQALLITLAARRALRPVGHIAGRLADLGRGDLSARVGALPQPDLAPVAKGVDDLATILELAQTDRARLQRQVVSRGDDERKAIARDLHDDMGPCLFGLRVEAEALATAATTPAIADHATRIATIAEEIGRVHRSLLDDLRPSAAGQLPLASVLADYLDDLGRRFPDIDFDLEITAGLPEPDEPTAVTLFRIVQEGTTNALRHSGADRVAIRLWTDPAHWRMILADNGTGFAEGQGEGTGLTGMRERITLLGGTLRLSSDTGGTVIEAGLPLLRNG